MKTGFLYLILFLAVFGWLEIQITHELIKYLNKSLGLMPLSYPREDMVGGKQVLVKDGRYVVDYTYRKYYPPYESPQVEQDRIDKYIMERLPSPPGTHVRTYD